MFNLLDGQLTELKLRLHYGFLLLLTKRFDEQSFLVMLVGLEIAQNTCAMFVMFRNFNFQVLADNCMHFVEEKLTVLGEMK